jgi:hypothetical protein
MEKVTEKDFFKERRKKWEHWNLNWTVKVLYYRNWKSERQKFCDYRLKKEREEKMKVKDLKNGREEEKKEIHTYAFMCMGECVCVCVCVCMCVRVYLCM